MQRNSNMSTIFISMKIFTKLRNFPVKNIISKFCRKILVFIQEHDFEETDKHSLVIHISYFYVPYIANKTKLFS